MCIATVDCRKPTGLFWKYRNETYNRVCRDHRRTAFDSCLFIKCRLSANESSLSWARISFPAAPFDVCKQYESVAFENVFVYHWSLFRKSFLLLKLFFTFACLAKLHMTWSVLLNGYVHFSVAEKLLKCNENQILDTSPMNRADEITLSWRELPCQKKRKDVKKIWREKTLRCLKSPSG